MSKIPYYVAQRHRNINILKMRYSFYWIITRWKAQNSQIQSKLKFQRRLRWRRIEETNFLHLFKYYPCWCAILFFIKYFLGSLRWRRNNIFYNYIMSREHHPWLKTARFHTLKIVPSRVDNKELVEQFADQYFWFNGVIFIIGNWEHVLCNQKF